MDPRKISHLSIEEKKAQFRQATITHRLLEQTHQKILRAVREPAGFTFLLVYGPTGVGKSKMIETIVGQITEIAHACAQPPISATSLYAPRPLTPVLVIEADPPDQSVFNRGYYYRTALTLMGEPTYQQHVHMDIHGRAEPVKRRALRGKAAESNDLPELKEATKEAMPRRGVRVVILDEAHHMLYGGNGMAGSTLQEQLEWLKSLSSTTQVVHILVGTYDLLNFGQLNGQISRRCLPVHFPRYLLQREEDCLEFQSALVSLLEKVPLRCDVATLVGSYWVYFYEGCIGAIGVLKDWLMRAVSTALDEGEVSLTLDCLADHAPPTDILRQMALDAYEGEQKLNHTESNREHLWRLLQGGELVAPIPPLPPRGVTEPTQPSGPRVREISQNDQISPPANPPVPEDTTPAAPPVKKTRSRKKAGVEATGETQGSVTGTDLGTASAPAPPKRRRKKTDAEVVEDGETTVKVTRNARARPDQLRLMPKKESRPPSRSAPGALGNPSPNGMLSANKRQNKARAASPPDGFLSSVAGGRLDQLVLAQPVNGWGVSGRGTRQLKRACPGRRHLHRVVSGRWRPCALRRGVHRQPE